MMDARREVSKQLRQTAKPSPLVIGRKKVIKVVKITDIGVIWRRFIGVCVSDGHLHALTEVCCINLSTYLFTYLSL